MLDLKFVRDNIELVRGRLATRGAVPASFDDLIQIDGERRSILIEVDRLKQERNELSKRVA